MSRTASWVSVWTVIAGVCLVFTNAKLHAQDKGKIKFSGPVELSASAPAADGELPGAGGEVDAERAQRFAKYMTGAKFVGRFTMLGSDQEKLPKEAYTITKCEVLDKPNMFRFTARIQYGDTDSELPMELPVVWAGDTPVISLTNLWIPGLGETFSSRVVIYQGSYAGTWKHGEKGGHLFGTIEKSEVKEAEGNGAAGGGAAATIPINP